AGDRRRRDDRSRHDDGELVAGRTAAGTAWGSLKFEVRSLQTSDFLLQNCIVAFGDYVLWLFRTRSWWMRSRASGGRESRSCRRAAASICCAWGTCVPCTAPGRRATASSLP